MEFVEGILVVAVSRQSPVAVKGSSSGHNARSGGEIFLLCEGNLRLDGSSHLRMVGHHVLREVRSCCVEASLVGEPFDSIDDPVGTDKLVTASHHAHSAVVDLPQGASSFLLDPIGRLIAVVPPGDKCEMRM